MECWNSGKCCIGKGYGISYKGKAAAQCTYLSGQLCQTNSHPPHMKAVTALGGICGPAHPFRGLESLGDYVMRIYGFDAIETHNGFNLEKANKKAIQVAQLKGLPSIGGSDCHERMQVGRVFTVFEKSVYTMEDLLREIKSGNCRGTLRKED